jgi:hypothetical protein
VGIEMAEKQQKSEQNQRSFAVLFICMGNTRRQRKSHLIQWLGGVAPNRLQNSSEKIARQLTVN